MIDLTLLAVRAAQAREAGLKAAAGTTDDGSCSRDLVHIPVGAGYLIERRSKRVRDALGGESVFERDSGFWRGYLIVPPGTGRASARLAACEAMAKVLSAYGARVYYARD